MNTQKKLRIMHFVYDHPDNPWCGGGGARRTWAINSILCRSHDITVVCGSFQGATPQDKPFKVRFLGKASAYVESRLKFILKSMVVKASSYDLVVEDFSVYAPIFPRLVGRPRITTLHSHYGLSALRYRGLYGIMSIFGECAILPQRKHVIIVSEHLKPAISQCAKIAVIGHGVDVPDKLPPPSEDYVLFLGRLDVKVKGIDVLLKAWAKLSQSSRVIPLYIAGGGDEATVRTLIKRHGVQDVQMIGRLDHHSALAVINRASFLCMPSRSEGFGLVAAEAMALGKPVIVSAIPSLRFLVPHGIAGLQVPPEDPELLSKAIERLLSDKALRCRLTEGALQVGKEFNWEGTAEKQEKFYWEVLEVGQKKRIRSLTG